MEKSVIIIGAGISGLSAGCYSQMNGYRTQIFEMYDKPGGLCTSWERQGYTINHCIHWFMGAGPRASHYKIWEELGAVQGKEMVYYDEMMRYEGIDGKVFDFYPDPDRLESHMKELSPEDSDVIEDFTKGIRTFVNFNMPVDKASELYSPFDRMKMMFSMMPYMPTMMKWGKVSSGEFARRFKYPLFREFFANFGPPRSGDMTPGFVPIMFMMVSLASIYRKSTGYPVGGSLEFARPIEQRYRDLGGEINYKSKVTRILVEDNCAVGVQLEDGSEHRADYVISAADGHTTIFDMLGGKYIDEEIQGYYDNLPRFPAILHVALGVNRTFEDFPISSFGIEFALDEPVIIAGNEMSRLRVSAIYNFDPTLAPEGKTSLRSWFPTDYGYWKTLYEDPERYKAEKEKVADTIVGILDKRFPGLAKQVEMRDVATPVTLERNTGNWQGSFEGWLPTMETYSMNMKKTLPGLSNFYMTGQWVQPAGTTAYVATASRNLFQIICREDKKKFVTSKP